MPVSYDEMDAAAKRKATIDTKKIIAEVKTIAKKLDSDKAELVEHIDAVGVKVDRIRKRDRRGRHAKHSTEAREACIAFWKMAQDNSALKLSTSTRITFKAAYGYYARQLAKYGIGSVEEFRTIVHSYQSRDCEARRRKLDEQRDGTKSKNILYLSSVYAIISASFHHKEAKVMTGTSRRGFIGAAAMAAGGVMAGCGTGAAARKGDGFIWAALLHMGTNMWCDQLPDAWGPYKGEDLKLVCKADHVRFDEKVWRAVTSRMAEVGMNMVVIDLGEAIMYPSHPELHVRGSWEIDRFRKELERLRAMGLEPIPKMNFSAGHDVWLKQYERMLSTPEYYKVCEDLIRDVAEIFDHPRFLHIGYDEETAQHQRRYRYCAVRQGDLWWHDFKWFVDTVEKAGMRPWMWSDYAWHHPDLFYSRMPKSVLQSNWYYGLEFDVEKMRKSGRRFEHVQTYIDLDKAGFDQIPTGSNWSCDGNFAATVEFCRRSCTGGSVKGYMTAPWFFTLPGWEGKLLAAMDQVGAVIRAGA